MKPPKIVSMIEVNGEWKNQDDLPQEIVRELVGRTIIRAGKNLGFEVSKVKKEKTA